MANKMCHSNIPSLTNVVSTVRGRAVDEVEQIQIHKKEVIMYVYQSRGLSFFVGLGC